MQCSCIDAVPTHSNDANPGNEAGNGDHVSQSIEKNAAETAFRPSAKACTDAKCQDLVLVFGFRRNHKECGIMNRIPGNMASCPKREGSQ